MSAGTIDVRMYSSQRPQFGIFVLIAGACWIGAVALKLGVPYFRKLP